LGVLVTLTACGGGSSGSDNDANALTITGTVSVAADQQAALSWPRSLLAKLSSFFVNDALAYPTTPLAAHVNVCIPQSNGLVPVPGHPTVVADAAGAFVISVDKNDIPASRQMFVCAKEPTADAYTVLAPISEDLLPADLSEVTTISVNPNANSTMITRYACSEPVMLFNSGRCARIENSRQIALRNAFNNFLDNNPQITIDLRSIDTTLAQLSNDFTVFTELDNWRQSEASGVTFQEFDAGAQNFAEPNVPNPQTVGVSVDDMACDISSNGDGSVTVTIAATGSGGGGNINVITNFLRIDGFGDDLISPDLGCFGGWQQTGGLATCSKGSLGSEFTSWIATYSFPTFTPPADVTSIVNGFASGSPTVLATDNDTAVCL
jgi:hypothetical protein